jgi:hypothetical protein
VGGDRAIDPTLKRLLGRPISMQDPIGAGHALSCVGGQGVVSQAGRGASVQPGIDLQRRIQAGHVNKGPPPRGRPSLGSVKMLPRNCRETCDEILRQ